MKALNQMAASSTRMHLYKYMYKHTTREEDDEAPHKRNEEMVRLIDGRRRRDGSARSEGAEPPPLWLAPKPIRGFFSPREEMEFVRGNIKCLHFSDKIIHIKLKFVCIFRRAVSFDGNVEPYNKVSIFIFQFFIFD